MNIESIPNDKILVQDHKNDEKRDSVSSNGKCDYVDDEEVSFNLIDDIHLNGKREMSIENCSINNDEIITELTDIPKFGNGSLLEIGDINLEKTVITKNAFVDNEASCDNSTECKKTYSDEFLKYAKRKSDKIRSALAVGDIYFLREAAKSRGGLLTDDIRRKVWPKLVGVDIFETSPRPSLEEIEQHPYYRQVVLDVNRSLKRFPPSIKESQRLAMLDQLVLLIMRVLCRHPELHYYQGYHDICVTFLLVLGEETAYYVLEKLSRTHLRIFMEQTMEPTIQLLECMYPLIGKKSSQLMKFLLKSEVGVAYCLSWLITWFGHVLNDYNDVVRLFDFFIVSPFCMPMYLTTAVVLHRESEVLKQECDMASVHSLLSKVPENLPFEDLIRLSCELHKTYILETLSKELSYLPGKKKKVVRSYGIVGSLAKTLKSSVPGSNFAVPLVIAAAVLVTAVLYQ
ncbi:TBC1 domain family member 20, partial [Stegodyphus mimosarum]